MDKSSKSRGFGSLLLAIVWSFATVGGWVQAQEEGPLVLKAQGSFFVGGHTIHTDAVTGTPGGLVGTGNGGSITVDQMYVQYQVPEGTSQHVPVVMLHGCCLTGKTYETTPDGRMGWGEYFVRSGRSVYIPDQVSRARSGFDATTINEVRVSTQPASALPNIFTFSHELAWEAFRFGPIFGTAFGDEQFPVNAADEFGKQVVPDLNAILSPTANPTWTNLSALAIQVGGAVLMGHSESGFFPEQAALVNAIDIRGAISLEPITCSSTAPTPEDIPTLAKIPILVVFGDHLGDVPSMRGFWLPIFAACQRFVQQINNAGGDATMLHLPDAGLFGNSHMFMQDKNNLQVADLILAWIDQHVEGKHESDVAAQR
jgi:hypothetical protein